RRCYERGGPGRLHARPGSDPGADRPRRRPGVSSDRAAGLRRDAEHPVRGLALSLVDTSVRRRHHASGVRVRSHTREARGWVSVVAAALLMVLAVLVLACADATRPLIASSRPQAAAGAAAPAAAQALVLSSAE